MEPSVLMNLTRGRIVHMLATHGSATASNIATALCLNTATVTRALGTLSDAGLIYKTAATNTDPHPAYAVDQARVVQEMAEARLFFAPWL